MTRLLIGTLILGFFGCGNRPNGVTKGWRERANRYARCFQVWERGEERKVIVYGSQDRSDTLAVIVIAPDSAADRVAVMSTTHLPFVEAIQRGGRVVAAAALGRVRGAYWKRRAEDGSLVEIMGAQGADGEVLIAQRVDAIFDYPFGRSNVRSTNGSARRFPVTEYMEEHPLGRAEWIRFFGTVLQAEVEADSLFEAIVRRYVAKEHESVASARPRVFFGSAWQGTWHVPPGDSYMARLINDAGGDFMFSASKGPSNMALGLEAVVAAAADAGRFGVILSHGGRVGALEMTGDTRLADMPVIHAGGFYMDSERSDIFGEALLEPDVLLGELNCIFRDTACDASGHRYVYRPAQ